MSCRSRACWPLALPLGAAQPTSRRSRGLACTPTIIRARNPPPVLRLIVRPRRPGTTPDRWRRSLPPLVSSTVYPLFGGAQVAHERRISVTGAPAPSAIPPVVPGLVGGIRCFSLLTRRPAEVLSFCHTLTFLRLAWTVTPQMAEIRFVNLTPTSMVATAPTADMPPATGNVVDEQVWREKPAIAR